MENGGAGEGGRLLHSQVVVLQAELKALRNEARQRAASNQKLLDTRLKATADALRIQAAEYARRLEGLSGEHEYLRKLTVECVTRNEYLAAHDTLVKLAAQNEAKIAALDEKLNAYQREVTRVGSSVTWMMGLAGTAVVGLIVALVLHVIGK